MASCPSDELFIESEKIHDLRICRKAIYYIDPTSEKILELGTKEYPYKSLNVMMHEVFDFFSRIDMEVTVIFSFSLSR